MKSVLKRLLTAICLCVIFLATPSVVSAENADVSVVPNNFSVSTSRRSFIVEFVSSKDVFTPKDGGLCTVGVKCENYTFALTKANEGFTRDSQHWDKTVSDTKKMSVEVETPQTQGVYQFRLYYTDNKNYQDVWDKNAVVASGTFTVTPGSGSTMTLDKPEPISRGTGDFKLTFTSTEDNTFETGNNKYTVMIDAANAGTYMSANNVTENNGKTVTFTIKNSGTSSRSIGENTVKLYEGRRSTSGTDYIASGKFQVIQGGDPALGTMGTKFNVNGNIDIYVIRPKEGVQDYTVWVDGQTALFTGRLTTTVDWQDTVTKEPTRAAVITRKISDIRRPNRTGKQKLCLWEGYANGPFGGSTASFPCDKWFHYVEFTEGDVAEDDKPVQGNASGDAGPVSGGGDKLPSPPPPPCAKDKMTNEGCTEVDSAVGALLTKPEDLIPTLFRLILGMAGGIATLTIIFAGYKYMTSQGNPEAVKGAQEMIVSAIAGLLFIIFSFVILQTIGQDVLRIPGFQ